MREGVLLTRRKPVCFPNGVLIKRSVRGRQSVEAAVGGQAHESSEAGAPSMSRPCAHQTLDPLNRGLEVT
jgi:hypothetical protein